MSNRSKVYFGRIVLLWFVENLIKLSFDYFICFNEKFFVLVAFFNQPFQLFQYLFILILFRGFFELLFSNSNAWEFSRISLRVARINCKIIRFVVANTFFTIPTFWYMLFLLTIFMTWVIFVLILISPKFEFIRYYYIGFSVEILGHFK